MASIWFSLRFRIFRTGELWVALTLALISAGPETASGTPLLALREADQCAACHNAGRSERPLLERRCTLDCQGCHIDPNGGGPRNQWGTYYELDSLSAMTFFQPKDPLTDESWTDYHYDGRVMSRSSSGDTRYFPMNSEFSMRLRPFITRLHLIWQGSFLGRPGTDKIDYRNHEVNRFQQKFSLMLDALPLNMYLRAFRGAPVYGVRRPNHSLWIRERTGLGQFALTDGVSVGGTPTVPFVHYSLMSGDPNEAPEDRQKGYSFHGGMRGVTLGWHVNGSAWSTKSQKVKVEMQAVGGGLKLPGVILMAEKNWRKINELTLTSSDLARLDSRALRVHPGSEIGEYTLALSAFKGMMPGLVYETLISDGIRSFRKSLFLDLHPLPFLQLEIWRRQETGNRDLHDTLVLIHVYANF